MKKIKTGFLIYLIVFIYLFLISFIYAIYLSKTEDYDSKIIEIIIGATTFLLLGFLYSNHFRKKGLIIGLLVGVIHIALLAIIFTLINNSFIFKPLIILIYLLSSTIGGILGINFKKLI